MISAKVASAIPCHPFYMAVTLTGIYSLRGIVNLKAGWDYEMKDGRLKENVGPTLAMLTVIGTFALFGLALFLKVDGANEKVLFMVIGALSSIAMTVVSYYFDSSEGSARKHEIFQSIKKTT
jgi:hypothetical protein